MPRRVDGAVDAAVGDLATTFATPAESAQLRRELLQIAFALIGLLQRRIARTAAPPGHAEDAAA